MIIIKRAREIIFILILCMILVTGCDTNDLVSKDSVFVPIKNGMFTRLVYHSKTKVMYVVSSNGTYTVLVNPDGSPMLYTKKEEDE